MRTDISRERSLVIDEIVVVAIGLSDFMTLKQDRR